ncbi:site-specific DNA-methyltransferase [Aminiphilus sp.]|uniref:site-specific DNA-methyltransferase n=1 Tax=Aminiphilus sp. TaxID=1872488 RepID=UPI002632D75A|nr:site-specific DNA-methyltransferase [Aminiphilus sp.]
MDQRDKKLISLLKELFQLDQPDLDFGVYRVMRARAAEITQFLEKDLLTQVKEAFAQYRPADKAAIERKLAETIEQAQALGTDPETLPKVRDLRTKLADSAIDLDALEAEVYDHLFSFFRRYYSEGDFLSKRVYKQGVYAIPYEGEEVKLHWANADQHYIKTSEYLRNYTFRLRPDAEKNPMRVHFRLVDAAEGEHGNVKEQAGKERRFKPAPEPFAAMEEGELVICFTYEPDPAKQKDLNAAAEAAILGLKEGAPADWLEALGAKHIRADGATSEVTRLRAHLDRYTARNTFDYFIHKDLGGFLRRELDFYIKNEVMHLDDVENESAPRVEQYLSKIKVIRKIAGKIIAFLAQVEDFQKKLWLKKKFVTETSWCVRLGVIPEVFYPEIAANDAQREEWIRLHAIDDLKPAGGNLFETGKPGAGEPLTVDLLKAQPTLMVDTRHFDADFTARLLAAVGDLDEQTDGVLVHSENFQALSLMQARYRERVTCIYIDPPYNTGNDGFVYKDNYPHSSWAAALFGRAEAALPLLHAESGSFFSSIDDGEQALLRALLSSAFGADNFVANIIWQKKYAPANDAKWFSDDHDFIAVFARNRLSWSPGKIPRTAAQDKAYANPDDDPRGPWKAGDYKSNKTADERPNLFYAIVNPNTGKEIWPQRNRVWAYSQEQHRTNVEQGRVWWGKDGTNEVPAYKRFLSEVGALVPRTLWKYEDVGHNQDGIRQLRDVLPDTLFTSPKPVGLIKRVVQVGKGEVTLDFFAGSGTTGHAVINLNREDGGRRKFILVEMADYFDTVLLPRLKKVAYSPEWKDGKPKRMATAEEAERSPRIFKIIRLESYEDTLNNLRLRRTEAQRSLFDLPRAQGPERLKEQYLLRYMLDVETRGSQSLLNIAAFTDPTVYTLTVKRPGSDESQEVNVDLIETFNWLIGLTVQHLAAPQSFTAEFERDGEGRLRLKGRLEQITPHPDPLPGGERTEKTWWFRTVTGATRDGRRTLVIWRKRPGEETPERIEQDNLVLDEWFTKQGYSSKDSRLDLIYVNGDNNLENLKTPHDTWKVRLIEEDFLRLMFEAEEE